MEIQNNMRPFAYNELEKMKTPENRTRILNYLCKFDRSPEILVVTCS